MSTTKQAVLNFIVANNIDSRTLSFFCNHRGEEHDTEFATCEITGVKAECAWCMARTLTGELIEFQANQDLVAGPLGRIGGAL